LLNEIIDNILLVKASVRLKIFHHPGRNIRNR